jgi:hypothetical protein
VAHEDRKRNFAVTVLSPDYTRKIGTISDYQTVSCTWSRLQVGTASLVGAERGLMLEVMRSAGSVVPITFKAPGLPRWTGRVVFGDDTRALGETGLVQATLVDERKWLSRILAAPVPGATWGNQFPSAHDKRTGQLIVIAKAIVQANVDRLAAEGYPTPIKVVPVSETSPTVTISARLKPLDEEFRDAFDLHGIDWDIRLWLPGDPVPAGMTLTTACILVDARNGRNQGYVRFTDESGGLARRQMVAHHPEAMGTVIGGPLATAEDPKTRTFQKVMATDGRVSALGKWGFPESWIENSDEDSTVRSQSGHDNNAEIAGKAAVVLNIADRFPWQAGPDADYWTNDLVRAEVSGIAVTDRISRISVTDNEEGYKVSAAFGPEQVTESADAQLTRRVAAMARSIQAMQAGR